MKTQLSKSIDRLIKRLEKNIDECAEKAVNNVVDTASRYAQQNYNSFAPEVASDDPQVFVFNTPLFKEGRYKYSREINCIGNQVLFIEFGNGILHYTGDLETRLYKDVLPINPRPSTIYDIGTYGKGYGMGMVGEGAWIRPTFNGRLGSTESHVHIKDKEGNDTGRVRQDVVWTEGSRPSRSLYRAVGMAVRRLLGGKFK